MGLFKRLTKCEDMIAKLGLEVSRIHAEQALTAKKVEELLEGAYRIGITVGEHGKLLEAIEQRMPDYEEAVAKGVDNVWNKALNDIMDFYPGMKPEGDKR